MNIIKLFTYHKNESVKGGERKHSKLEKVLPMNISSYSYTTKVAITKSEGRK